MIRLFVLTTLIITTAFAKAQDTISVFKVGKHETEFTIIPENNILVSGIDNKICIKIEGWGKIAKVEFAGGRIIEKDGCYIVNVNTRWVDEGLLSVYELLPGGESQLVLNKKYQIIEGPHTERLNDGERYILKQGEKVNKTP